LPMSSVYMRLIIRENGHLLLDGTEKRDDLKEAILNLYRYHRYSQCRRPDLGTPIECLIPEEYAVTEKYSRKRRNVHNVDMSRPRL
jgi:hypothetical protein